MGSLIRTISFSQRIFVSVLLLFLSFAVCFVIFQYQREKSYKTELLHTRLQNYNERMYEKLQRCPELTNDTIDAYVRKHLLPDLRVTIIKADGQVIYDNKHNLSDMENHLNREEVQEALQTGSGYDMHRTSVSMQHEYFYSASYFPDGGYIIRSALPYDLNLMDLLAVDRHYMWFSLILIIILTYVYYKYTRKLGKNINQLRIFAKQAESEANLENLHFEFPNNELGEISRHIVHLYTQLKKSEEDKVRLKRQLTQNIAHELKTPVSSIQGYLETIITNPEMDERQKRIFMERCHAQSNRLADLLRDISMLTRMDEVTQGVDKEDMDIYQLVLNVEKDVTLQLTERNITFLKLLPSPMMLKGNYSLLYSIFRNLTDNAIAYAGENTTITIKCLEDNPKFYRFSFADNGIGIAPEHLEHIFERFYRIDKGRSRKLGGTGLGLAIVKNSVLMHGGSIHAKIASTGGLEFVFTLSKS